MTNEQFNAMSLKAFFSDRMGSAYDNAPGYLVNPTQAQDPIFKLAECTVSIEKSSSGAITAESVKLFNVLKVSQTKLRSSLFPGLIAGILGAKMDSPLTILLSTLGLIASFLPYATKTFSELDAEVLYAIYSLQQKKEEGGIRVSLPIHWSIFGNDGNNAADAFSLDEIQHEYKTIFNSYISLERLVPSLEVLVEYKTIGVLNGEKVYLVEEIEVNRQ
ncbi:hypothetical protein GCM10027275_10250 [Rhabdobacter roseus]|uniref:Uncharacterized protein n=1 Tax=Rhabdobacter roseus TaxID=1655419 RepID=A0A840TI08_9BACT|nr:hypothetical protein [Rhabdobacter roseus]MBB5282931.1 hypothetical protein [Rhabdobacter roseus]